MSSTGSDNTMFQKADAYEAFMGRYSRSLAPEFARAAGVAAVDPSEPFVEECRASVPGADVRVAPAEDLPFDDGTFDRAVSQLVFHFVQDPAASVREMARVTRPGGRVASCVWDMTGGMTM